MPGFNVLAPLTGWCLPLDEVPDAVFSARMLGDGLAIEPTGNTLFAPCDGTITTIATQKHAVTLRAASGAEILMHVGIDTVALAGQGFNVHVAPGQSVMAGAPLLSFDIDLLARRAKSLITPVIVTDGERFTVARRAQDRALAIGDLLFELRATDALQPVIETGEGEQSHREVVVPLPHGIHARPAAMLASRLKGFVAGVTLEAHGRSANARSPMAMMALGVRKGDVVMIRARGIDAAAAIEALVAAMVDSSLHETAESPAAARPVTIRPVPRRADEIAGVIACRGLAAGRAVHLTRPEIHVEETGAGVAIELSRLEGALRKVSTRLQTLASGHQEEQRGIVSAHLALLEDPELLSSVRASISQGRSGGFAWRESVRAGIAALRASGDARLVERVDDLLDLESQVLLAMSDNAEQPPSIDLLPDSILLARELLPSQLVTLDSARIAGICVSTGGPTSHVAILAAATDIPMLVAMGPAIQDIPDGSALVLDADAGVLRIAPDANQRTSAEEEMTARRVRRSADLAAARRECRTADGERIQIFANAGSVADARDAITQGAEGCGLLRTEFLFLDRQAAPTLAEQQRHYRAIADVFADRPLVIRTLDIGGDKPVPYIQLPREENPALGLRGIRVGLQSPALLREQLSAIIQAGGPAHCHILLPMITDAVEIRAVREIIDGLRVELGIDTPIPVGAMVETPAAAVGAGRIAAEADFLSIGTNDLTQYTLAIDRGHPQLAAKFDGLHPAVLSLIATTVEAAHAHGKPVAVCGGLASDPRAVPILIGLGIRELSVVPAAIPQLKRLIGELSTQECAELAAAALER